MKYARWTAARGPLLAVALVATAGVAAQDAIVEDLGTLGGDASYALDINRSGQVCGYALDAAGRERAFRATPGAAMEDLGTPSGDEARGKAINAAGQVAGTYTDATGKPLGFRYTDGIGTEDLGGLGTNAGVYPEDLNDAGQVVGWSFTNGMQVVFLFSDGAGMEIVGPAPSSDQASLGYGVNDAGQAVGVTADLDKTEGILITLATNQVVGIGTLGGDDSWPYAIDDRGTITGWAQTELGDRHAFLRDAGGGLVDLGTLGGVESEARGLNELDYVVGFAEDATGERRAFLWRHGEMVDLNALLPPGSGWLLEEAHGINAAGQIAGFGTRDGAVRAFRLTLLELEAPVAGFRVSVGDVITGDVGALNASDDDRLVIAAKLDGAETQYRAGWTVAALSPTREVSGLDVSVELKGSVAGVPCRLSLRNFDTESWTTIARLRLDDEDQVHTFADVPDANAYVDDATRRVLVRTLCGADAARLPDGFTADSDELQVDVGR